MAWLKKVGLSKFLTLISILGFLTITISAWTGVDIGQIVDGLLFGILGLALAISGGYRQFFKYFDEGLTQREVNNLTSIFLGVVAIVIGLLTLIGVESEGVNVVKGLIALLAILLVSLEGFKK